MTDSEIIQAVNEVFIDSFEIPPGDIKPEAQIFGDLGLDSLDAVDMLVNLEDKIGVKVDVDRIKTVRTLQDIYDLVENVSAVPGVKIQLDQ